MAKYGSIVKQSQSLDKTIAKDLRSGRIVVYKDSYGIKKIRKSQPSDLPLSTLQRKQNNAFARELVRKSN